MLAKHALALLIAATVTLGSAQAREISSGGERAGSDQRLGSQCREDNAMAPECGAQPILVAEADGWRLKAAPPTVNGVFVDHCRTWATDCGQGGALAYCKSRGYPLVKKFGVFDRHVGDTFVIGSNRTCSGELCRALAYVECEKIGAPPEGGVEPTSAPASGPAPEPDEPPLEAGPAGDPGPLAESDPAPDMDDGMGADTGAGMDPDAETDSTQCPAGAVATVDIPEPHLRKLNVRKSPGGKVVTTVLEGSQVTVVGECGFEHAAGFARGEQLGGLQWCQIDGPIPGCVLAKYLSFGGADAGELEDEPAAGFKRRSKP